MSMSINFLELEGESLLIDGEAIYSRLQEKREHFRRYNFSIDQSRVLNIFFDLAQEFNSTAKIHTLAVLIPYVFFGVEAQLFILEPVQTTQEKNPTLELKASSVATGGLKAEELASLLGKGPSWFKGFFCCPVLGRSYEFEEPELPPKEQGQSCEIEEKLGIFVFRDKIDFGSRAELFFEKYTNRLGVHLHNRLLSTRNLMHIRFVKNLVHDIGHNVIVPNMYFKLLIQQLSNRIEGITSLKCAINSEKLAPADIAQNLSILQQRLQEQYTEIYRHFQQTSLFLESLLRQSHFDQGRYVLQKSKINLIERVVFPQFDRFLGRMRERNIMPCMPTHSEANIIISADVGLLSQVLANLLSNAVKYTREDNASGKKHVSCSVEVRNDYFNAAQSKTTLGVKISVISSGPLIDSIEAEHLFEAQFRASNTRGENGTGHGLHFVHEMIAQHDGKVGYEVVDNANSFYFILPCELENS